MHNWSLAPITLTWRPSMSHFLTSLTVWAIWEWVLAVYQTFDLDLTPQGPWCSVLSKWGLLSSLLESWVTCTTAFFFFLFAQAVTGANRHSVLPVPVGDSKTAWVF